MPPSSFTQFTTPADKYVGDVIPRLAVAANGQGKSGKTHWALMTTPEPILIATTDTGTRAIVDKAVKAKRKIAGVMDVVYASPDPTLRKASDIDVALHAAWKAEWAKFKGLCESLVNDRTIKTLVVDKANNINNLLELAFFGKLKGNQAQNVRTDMNSEFHKLFWDLYKKRPDLNMIWIHDHKKQYIPTGKVDHTGKPESVWNGKWEQEGHSKISAYVDMTLDFGWEPTVRDFYSVINETNPIRYMQLNEEGNFDLGGRRYSKDGDRPSHFGYMAMDIFPETQADPEYWGL